MIKAKRFRMIAKQQVLLEDFELDDSALKPREITVRLEFTAISPGTECAIYQALESNVFVPGKWGSYPFSPGYAGCGQVIGVGAAVTDFKVGDRVAGTLQHASHGILEDKHFVAVDPRVKPEHAAYLRLLSIAFTPLQVLQLEPLPVVGVWGLGMIGNLVAQLLQRAGGRVIGIDPVVERRVLATRCGLEETLDPTAANFPDQLKTITRGEGLDIAVDTTGHAPTTLGMPSFIRWRGQMVLMTHWRSQPTLDASPFIRAILEKGITLHGAHESAPAAAPALNPYAFQRRKWLKLMHELATGGVQVAPLISHVIKPPQCKEAYEGLSFDRATWWGVVVDWRGDLCEPASGNDRWSSV